MKIKPCEETKWLTDLANSVDICLEDIFPMKYHKELEKEEKAIKSDPYHMKVIRP